MKSKNRGVTLIESLVAVMLLSLVSVTFYEMFLLAGRLTADSKTRMMAVYLANEEMEILKSMAYSKIGTQGGVPAGTILQSRNISKGGYNFLVKTEVKFSDDPLDGVFPADNTPSDFKTVRLEVSWPSHFKQKQAVLVSSIYPETPEQEEGGGVLSFNAINFEGLGIAGCDVEIKNEEIAPPVAINTRTDDGGNVLLLGLSASQNGYEIKLNCSGMEEIRTLPPYPESVFRPVNEHATVVLGSLNLKTIEANQLGNLKLIFKDEKGALISGLDTGLSGGRIEGYTVAADPLPVYVFSDESILTNGVGEVELEEASGGNYFLTINDLNSELVRASVDLPLVLTPGSELEANFTVVKKTLDSLLVSALDSVTKEPIGDILVTVKKGEDYNQSIVTDFSGKAFFWEENMAEGEYQIEVNAAEYQPYTGTVALERLTKKDVFLERIP